MSELGIAYRMRWIPSHVDSRAYQRALRSSILPGRCGGRPCAPRRPVADPRVGVARGSMAGRRRIDRGQEVEGHQPDRRARPAKPEIDRLPSNAILEHVDRIEHPRHNRTSVPRRELGRTSRIASNMLGSARSTLAAGTGVMDETSMVAVGTMRLKVEPKEATYSPELSPMDLPIRFFRTPSGVRYGCGLSDRDRTDCSPAADVAVLDGFGRSPAARAVRPRRRFGQRTTHDRLRGASSATCDPHQGPMSR